MSEQRYDIFYHENGPSISPHFCREMECFGTNPDHGYTFDEAISQIIQWHLGEAQALLAREHRLFDVLRSREIKNGK